MKPKHSNKSFDVSATKENRTTQCPSCFIQHNYVANFTDFKENIMFHLEECYICKRQWIQKDIKRK
jgi:hypothetical protein